MAPEEPELRAPRLKPELFADLDSLEGVRKGLRHAVRLEHATIPTYLYALYSLAPGANTEIADLIGGIVAEEMAHLALAANVLNAIGGGPVPVDDPRFIPKYPGPLPGGVDADLTVPLAPFSIDLVRKVFMVIEHPDHALEFPDVPPPELRAQLAAQPEVTIGAFYRKIAKAIGELGEGIFTGNPSLQMSQGFAAVEVIPVTSVQSAQKAIGTIVEQGEGTLTSPVDPDGSRGDLAHFYRFEEIAKGRQLVPNPHAGPKTPPKERYAYNGPPIPFDADAVLRLVENPKADRDYPAGSRLRALCDTFNYTYTSLLKALHVAFNGAPDTLPNAIGLMWSLKAQFNEMSQIPTDPKVTGSPMGAPSFEYLAVLP
jgi:hypothetical protein